MPIVATPWGYLEISLHDEVLHKTPWGYMYLPLVPEYLAKIYAWLREDI